MTKTENDLPRETVASSMQQLQNSLNAFELYGPGSLVPEISPKFDLALMLSVRIQRQLAGLQLLMVRDWRAQGASWDEIGLAMSMSKQAAWERFSKLL